MALYGLSRKKIVWMGCLGILISSCTGNYQAVPSSTTSTTSTTVLQPGQNEPAARIIFHQDFFTDVDDYNPDPAYHPSILTEYRCPGDLIKTFYANAGDYSGTPTSMAVSNANDTFQPTVRPQFLKNVSVDITNSYFPSVMTDLFLSDVCSHRQIENSPLPSSCADFDRVPYSLSNVSVATSTPTPMPTPTTNEYFNSGFYRVRDDWCIAQGPVVQPDPEATKEGVGGVSIDIDRTKLSAKEDLLMVVTYHALNENSKAGNWPASQAVDGTPTAGVPPAVTSTDHTQTDRTILKVNLVGTGEALDTILGVRQPRVWAYTNQASYPIYHKEIATLEDPFGSLRSEQVYLPISQNAFIDRIRIERDRGSYHLFQIDLYRLGNRIE
jgi:hypothetical protein